MASENENARKIKNATQEELGKLQKEYEALMKNVRGMSPAGLLAIAVAGIAMILYFRNNFLDLIGLALLLCPLYLLIQRDAHKSGYFEGYYEMMTKMGKRVEDERIKNGPKEPEQDQSNT